MPYLIPPLDMPPVPERPKAAPTDNKFHLKQAKLHFVELRSNLRSLLIGLKAVHGQDAEQAATVQSVLNGIAECEAQLDTIGQVQDSYGALKGDAE